MLDKLVHLQIFLSNPCAWTCTMSKSSFRSFLLKPVLDFVHLCKLVDNISLKPVHLFERLDLGMLVPPMHTLHSGKHCAKLS